MKMFFKNVIIKKILIVLITIIMTSNFIMPNYVHAAQTPGKNLVSGFFYLLGYIGDEAIKIMQEIMLGNASIKVGEQYRISYSPGIIFSNEVPALDINFINPMPAKKKLQEANIPSMAISDITTGEAGSIFNRLASNRIKTDGYYSVVPPFTSYGGEISKIKHRYDWENRDYRGLVSYSAINYDDWFEDAWDFNLDVAILGNQSKINEFWISDNTLYFMVHYYLDYMVYGELAYTIFSVDLTQNELQYFKDNSNIPTSITTPTDDDYNKSVAGELQNNIATWYVALRTIALVGLLSVLVYLGIRIILSSTSAQDKAKYKNMLKDWVVAICILFMLHYIMAFMLNITAELNEIIKDNVIKTDSSGRIYDDLMSNVRNQFSDDFDNVWVEAPGRVVMYLALVILTGVFTFQYLKRVIFMAFLTMIAPMIALTYPIDKVKDGKAQAFSYWLREYIFNCLIQPVHLLLYTILITNAIDFATKNILYAIVALGFMVPAEKFIKDMFGMKSESPTGQLGAAAGGAMVMSMLNKIKAKPPKDDAGAGKSSNSNNIRNASEAGGTSGGDAGTGLMANNGGGTPPLQRNSSPILQKFNQTKFGQSTTGQKVGKAASSIGGVVGRGSQRLIKNQANMLKSAGKWSGKALKSLPGAALGATVGLAATVASGGEKAGAFIGGGAMAGAALSQNLTDSTFNGVGTEIQKGWYGEEGYKTRQAKKEFFASDAWKGITEDGSIDQTNIRERVENLIDNGITDGKEMQELLKAGITGEGAKEYKDAGVTSAKAMKEFSSNGIDAAKLKSIKLATGETDSKKMLRYNAIANAAKSQNQTDPQAFINWAKTEYKMDDEDAQKLLNQCKHYW